MPGTWCRVLGVVEKLRRLGEDSEATRKLLPTVGLETQRQSWCHRCPEVSWYPRRHSHCQRHDWSQRKGGRHLPCSCPPVSSMCPPLANSKPKSVDKEGQDA